MPIDYQKIELVELLKKDEGKKLVLPNYQREFVWNNEQQATLLTSVLAGVPIGSVLILQGNSADFDARQLGRNDTTEPTQECEYLLDGQQRLSTLKTMFSDLLGKSDWQMRFDVVYSRLRNRWFLNLKPKADKDAPQLPDLFGFDILRFEPKENEHEPTDYRPFVEYRTIYKTKLNQWHHPAWKPPLEASAQTPERLRLEVARAAAAEQLVPLWELFVDPKNGLHYRALDLIAKARVQELRAEVKDGKRSVADLLRPGYSAIDEAIEAGDEEQIADAWKDLEANWCRDLRDFLVNRVRDFVPYISLPADDIHRAISIFETVNRGGTPLNVFDLVAARLARSAGSAVPLAKLLVGLLEQETSVPDPVFHHNMGEKPAIWSANNMGTVEDGLPSASIKQLFLNVLSILCFKRQFGLVNLKTDQIKRARQLSLSVKDLRENVEPAARLLARGLMFLQFRCGVVAEGDLKYKLMALPVCFALEDDVVWTDRKKLDRVEYWYWASLFGGAYRERQNERCTRDVTELSDWLRIGGNDPFENRKADALQVTGYSDLATLRRDPPADSLLTDLDDCVLQYVLSRQPRDFLEDVRLSAWGCSSNAQKKQDHHVVPLASQTKVGESSKAIRADKKHILNSVLNRTFILARTNNQISGRDITSYIQVVSAVAQIGHFIPEVFLSAPRPSPGQDPIEFYTAALGARYNALRDALWLELDNLRQP